MTVALAAAAALRGAGADWLTTVAAALSALFAFHAGYAAMVGLIALLVAAFLWERTRLRPGSPVKRPYRARSDQERGDGRWRAAVGAYAETSMATS